MEKPGISGKEDDEEDAQGEVAVIVKEEIDLGIVKLEPEISLDSVMVKEEMDNDIVIN